MMLDASKQDIQRELLEKELESVGIRLNKQKPNIYFKVSDWCANAAVFKIPLVSKNYFFPYLRLKKEAVSHSIRLVP